MKNNNIITITIVILFGLVIYFAFIKKQKVITIDNKDDITRLEVRHVWDSIERVKYTSRYYTDSLIIEANKDTIKIKNIIINNLLQQNKNNQIRIDTSNIKELDKQYDNYVGKKTGKTIKSLDSTQLIKSVKLFVEAHDSRGVIDKLMDINNRWSIVVAEQKESLINCNNMVNKLDSVSTARNEENKQFIVDNKKECDKRVAKEHRKTVGMKIALIGVGVAVLLGGIFSGVL